MNKSAVPSPFWEQATKDQKIINFYPTPSDSTHFIVSRLLEGGMERLGHVYVEFEGDEFRYISTNREGKKIFAPTTEFNVVEINFEKYARFLALQKVRNSLQRSKILNHNINLKNIKTMKTHTNNKTEKTQKQNQFVFIEYEKPTAEGHFITIMDSYRYIIGRVHENLNEQTKKSEYSIFDHEGKPMLKGEKLGELKNEIIKNREQLLEQAHQRRIASNLKSKEVSNEKSPKVEQVEKTNERKNEMKNLRKGRTGKEKQNERTLAKEIKSNDKVQEDNKNRVNERQNNTNQREQELDDLRNDRDDDREDMNLDR